MIVESQRKRQVYFSLPKEYRQADVDELRERIKLAKQALTISDDCVDAYVLLAEESAKTLPEARDLYAIGVKAGERVLGKELFTEAVGHFWGMVETRPYMRARAGLANCLWLLGEYYLVRYYHY